MSDRLIFDEGQQNVYRRVLYVAYLLWMLVLPWSLALMQIALGIVVAAAIASALTRRPVKMPLDTFTIMIGIYLVIRILTALFSAQPGKSLISVMDSDWPVPAVLLLSVVLLSLEEQRRMLHVLFVSSILLGMYAIYQFYAGYDPVRDRALHQMGNYFRATGGYGFYLTLAGNQLLIFCLALGMMIMDRYPERARGLYLLTTILAFITLLTTFARSTWLATLLVLFLGVALFNKRYFWYTAAGVLVVGGLSVAIVPEIQERLFSIFDPAQNVTRLNLWKSAVAIISDHPILGTGPGSFRQVLPDYQVPGFYDSTAHPHNDYLSMAVESGIVGLLAWLGIWLAWFIKTLKIFRQPALPMSEKALLLGSILGIFGILTAAFFQCYYTDLENHIFWWFTALQGYLVVRRYQAQLSSPAGSS